MPSLILNVMYSHFCIHSPPFDRETSHSPPRSTEPTTKPLPDKLSKDPDCFIENYTSFWPNLQLP